MSARRKTWPFYLANEAVTPNGDLVVEDKHTGTEAARVAQADAQHVARAIDAAHDAAHAMAQTAEHERESVLRHLHDRLRERAAEIVELLIVEAGKTITDARSEFARALGTTKIAAEEATRLYGEYLPLSLHEKATRAEAISRYAPIGPCAFITPFNFPLNLVLHKVAPALAAGCPFVLKPAPNAPLCALVVGEILAEASLPKGAFSVLTCEPEDAKAMIEDDRLKLLSFTGSDAVGWKLKAQAGKKRVVLELGGDAACIVDDGAELDRAAARIAFGAYYQGGQSCISVQRILAHDHIYDALKQKLVRAISKLKDGDPRADDTFLSPLITEDDAKRVESWVREAVDGGATILCGGRRRGRTYEPSLLENVPPDGKIAQREVFGPVAYLRRFASFDEACAMTNESRYGLQAGVFTPSLRNAWHAFDALEVGQVIINDVPAFRVDAMPYGGVKDSGMGREGLRYAMREMCELRTMVLRDVGGQ